MKRTLRTRRRRLALQVGRGVYGPRSEAGEEAVAVAVAVRDLLLRPLRAQNRQSLRVWPQDRLPHLVLPGIATASRH